MTISGNKGGLLEHGYLGSDLYHKKELELILRYCEEKGIIPYFNADRISKEVMFVDELDLHMSSNIKTWVKKKQ